MNIKLKCPKCQTKFKAPRDVLGNLVICPGCQGEFRAPTPERAREKMAAKRAAREGASQPAAAPAGGGGGFLVWTLALLGIAVAVVVLSVVFDIGPARTALSLLRGEQQAPDQDDDVLPLDPASEDEDEIPVPSTSVDEDDEPDTSIAPGDPADENDPPESENPDQDPPAEPPVDDPDAGQLVVPGNAPALAAQAEEVLRATCYRCHGQNGTAEGGFNVVLSRDRLAAGGQYVVPGKADESYLLDRISSNEMPPAGEEPRPSQSQVALLKQWINAGAPDFAPPLERDFITNKQVLRFIRDDLEQTPDRDRRYARYFTLTHLYNASFSVEEMQTYRLALAKLANSVSWNRTITLPKPIDPAETVYRIDLRDFDWTDKIWQIVVEANPYSIIVESPDGKFVREATESQLPYLRADWFVAAGSRPPLYHDLLQVPGTVKELEKLLSIDTGRNIAEERVARAGFLDSGVSKNNRLIERHDSPYGAYWVSYDFGSNKDRKDLNQHPLGPGKEESHFLADGGEIIFNLPNGLQGYMLADADGKRLEKGPTQIVSDPKRPDRAVTNGVSCMSCHFGGMIVKQDTIRAHVETNRGSFPEAEDILALYPTQPTMEKLFAEDAERFREAAAKVGLGELTSTGEPVVNMALRFESDMDLKLASSELGLQSQEFSDTLPQFPQLARSLGALRVPGGIIKREVFVALFGQAVKDFDLGTPLAVTVTTETAPAETTPETKPEPTPEVVVNPDLRAWQGVNDSFKIEGEYVAFNLGKVSIKKTDGKIVGVPLERLSQADQDFVLSQPGKAVDLPPGEDLVAGSFPTEAGPPARPPKPAPRPRTPPKGDFRPWFDELEGREYEAEFMGLRNGMVRLKRTNGIVIYLPLVGISKPDQEYVRERVGEIQYKRNSQAPELPYSPGDGP